MHENKNEEEQEEAQVELWKHWEYCLDAGREILFRNSFPYEWHIEL